mgnify:FL=1
MQYHLSHEYNELCCLDVGEHTSIIAQNLKQFVLTKYI